jgi:hypothetical protein
MTSTLLEDHYTFFIISRPFIPRMRMLQKKNRIKISTHVFWSLTFFSENLAGYEMWKKNV